MIALVGDVHGSFAKLDRLLEDLPAEVSHVIQLGDLGIWPTRGMPPGTRDYAPARPFCYIEGNWDYLPWCAGHDAPHEVLPGITHVPRGTILELDGRRVAFLGGAESTSLYRRTRNINFWPELERIQPEEVERFRGKVADLLVTHLPPTWVNRGAYRRHSAPPPTHAWRPESLDDVLLAQEDGGGQAARIGGAHGRDAVQASSRLVERAWDLLGRPLVVSAHLHKSVRLEGARVLTGLEVVLV